MYNTNNVEQSNGAYWQHMEKSKVGEVGPFTLFITSDNSDCSPHFHIIDSASYKNENGSFQFHTRLLIQQAKYFEEDPDNKIDVNLAKELLEFLSSAKKNNNDTNWQYLIHLWNDNNSFVAQPDIPIPDYTKLCHID